MTTYLEITTNIATGEEIIREYDAAEVAEVEKAQAEAAAVAAQIAEKKLLRESIFKKLGITEEEAKLLLS